MSAVNTRVDTLGLAVRSPAPVLCQPQPPSPGMVALTEFLALPNSNRYSIILPVSTNVSIL